MPGIRSIQQHIFTMHQCLQLTRLARGSVLKGKCSNKAFLYRSHLLKHLFWRPSGWINSNVCKWDLCNNSCCLLLLCVVINASLSRWLFKLHLFIYLPGWPVYCVYMCMDLCMLQNIGGYLRGTSGLGLSFPQESIMKTCDKTRVVRLAGEHLYWLSLFMGPCILME